MTGGQGGVPKGLTGFHPGVGKEGRVLCMVSAYSHAFFSPFHTVSMLPTNWCLQTARAFVRGALARSLFPVFLPVRTVAWPQQLGHGWGRMFPDGSYGVSALPEWVAGAASNLLELQVNQEDSQTPPETYWAGNLGAGPSEVGPWEPRLHASHVPPLILIPTEI